MTKTLFTTVSKAVSLLLLTSALALPAAAMSASEAKSKGLIEEDCQGYVKPKSDAGKAVANDINSQRRAEYERLAKEQKVDVSVVAATTGAKLCGK